MQFLITIWQELQRPLLLLALFGLACVFFAKPILRLIAKRMIDDFTGKLLSDPYDQNLAELLPSLKRFSVINLIELSLRAQTGKVIARPSGSYKTFLAYDQLMFSPRQMTSFSLPADAAIDMSVTLGVTAEKPLSLKIPLLIGGMAYGTGLSEEAKLALAKASRMLHTATCSGEGPFLPEEADEAGKFVLQICCWSWGERTDEQIAVADMLEIKMGQGSDMGTAVIEAVDIEGRARMLGGIAPKEPVPALPAPPGVESPEDWPRFMQNLRQRANGIPIALKLMATDRLEQELAVAVDLGFDVIVIDGCEGGSHATPPIKQDDFGIPSLYALVRAKRFLKDKPVSLVIAGGYFTPGQCLKALTLGADAIYLGTIPIFALGHNQTAKALPWEPPTTLVYYNSPSKTQLDIDQAASSVANVLTSMVLEMEEAMRALGRSSLKELTADDLTALDPVTAELTGVRKALSPANTESNPQEQQLQQTLQQFQHAISDARQITEVLETALTALQNSPAQTAGKQNDSSGKKTPGKAGITITAE